MPQAFNEEAPLALNRYLAAASDAEWDFGPICKGRSVWNCRRVGTKNYTIYIYEEHHTHRAHCWRRRPRRCVSTNTASNSPSTETSLIPAEFSAKKPQNLKQ